MSGVRVIASIRHTTDLFVVAFASWTVLAHVVVWNDFGFDVLVWSSWLTLGPIAAWWKWGGDGGAAGAPPAATPSSSAPAGVSLLAVGVALVLCGLFIHTAYYTAAWFGAVGLLAWQRWREGIAAGGEPALGEAPLGPSRGQIGALALAVFIACTAVLFGGQWDADDSLYMNMAVSVLDAPSEPIFVRDTLQDIPGATYLPSYRVHSFELFAALLSRLTSLAPISLVHFPLALLAAVLAVFAFARLFQNLAPRRWPELTLVTVVVLLVLRDSPWIYGSFAWSRLYEGKSWFVVIASPLVCAYAIEYFRAGGVSRWWALAAAQAAAIGLTANALYGAPIIAGLSLLASWQGDRAGLRRLVLGVVTCVYPVVMGAIALSAMLAMDLVTDEVGPSVSLPATLTRLFGTSGAAWLWWFALLAGGAFAREARTRRWLLGYALAFVTIFMSPFWADLIAARLTGAHLLWRLFWAIPLPAVLAIVLLWIGRAAGHFVPRGGTAVAAALIVAILLLSNLPGTQKRLSPWRATPQLLKVPESAYADAAALVQLTEPRDHVLAPEDVTAWVPTFRGHPLALVTRILYTDGVARVMQNHVDVDDIRNRTALTRYVSGVQRSDDTPDRLREALTHYPLAAVGVYRDNEWALEIEDVLRAAGYCLASERDLQIYVAPRLCP